MSKVKIANANLQIVDKYLYPSILEKIYTSVNFQKIRYQLLNNKSYLDEIKSKKYYITPHFQGYNFLLAFFTINNIKYNLLIMKNLKYWKDQNNIEDIKIYKFDTIKSDINLYNGFGTIFDGKMIFSSNNQSSFIIHDMFILNGKNTGQSLLSEKLDKINNILSNIKINESHNFDCKVCKLYLNSELPDLLFNKIKTTELKINGLMFLPEYTSKYFIYTNDTEFEELKTNTNINITIKKTNNSSQVEFYMKKTNIPDVYELYDTDENSLVKEGIAHIPNIKTSHYFRTIFRDKNMIKINCIKSDKFNKWIPICDDFIDYSDAIF
jgi:hypothetical protein